jgi:hypothetical protein
MGDQNENVPYKPLKGRFFFSNLLGTKFANVCHLVDQIHLKPEGQVLANL